MVKEDDEDFKQSGLKVTSVIRVGRLAVVSGAIGEISDERLKRVKQNLSNWLSEKQNGGQHAPAPDAAPLRESAI
ncbi:MAG: hypothetical protein ACUVSF_13620 [Anaerolineae bacterium]